MLAALLAGTLVLFGFGQALGARSKHQRAADLAAVSAAQVMSRHYSRLFEPAVLANGLPNPRHTTWRWRARPRCAGRGATGVPPDRVRVEFPGAGFAPTRVAGDARVVVGAERERAPLRASATAEIAPDAGAAFGMPGHGSGGGYDGPLAYRMGEPMPHWFFAL